jgi:Zn-finger nucleic acid-binding protein
MLACPQCGANVPDDCTTCAYCHAALLVKPCPRCLARVFDGHKHCPECGAALAAAAAGTPSARACPRCHVAMVTRTIADVALDDCTQCGGSWVDRPTIERVLAERRQVRADELLGAYDAAGDAPLPAPPGPMYVKCPGCAQIMNRKQFARGAKVIVDVCRDHGTWFDAHELPRVIRFVMSGGLERAAHEQIDEDKERARRMMADARTAQVQAMRTIPSVGGRVDYGTIIADVLFQLWK